MRTRVLSADEVGGSGANLLPYVHPDNAAVAVVEDEGKIVARIGVYSVTYYEDVWVDPEYRGNLGVIRALLRQAAALPQNRGECWVVAASADEQMSKYLSRMGVKLPVETFCLAVGELCHKQQ